MCIMPCSHRELQTKNANHMGRFHQKEHNASLPLSCVILIKKGYFNHACIIHLDLIRNGHAPF